jgi:hypothetical protein
MAAPTPTTQAYENGNVYHLSWTATWSDTTNLSDTAVIDVSGMTSPFTGGVKLIKGWVNASAGIGVLLEFDDDSTDELILEHPVGASGHIPFDFRDSPSGGKTYKGSGGTGDIVITTTSAASADDVSMHLETWLSQADTSESRI